MVAFACFLFLTLNTNAQSTTGVPGCHRNDGSLTRYLLCVELQERRPPETHPTYFAELDALETTVLAELPRRNPGQRRNILPALYHANRDDTAYLHRLTLVETLDGRRGDPQRRLSADCDLFSLINAGISERYYGIDSSNLGVVLVRTRRDHVMTADRRGVRLAGLLETESGTVYRDSRVLRAGYDQFEFMTEPEIVALYLAHVGLALAVEGRETEALKVLDEAIGFAPSEYVAHVGKALALLLAAATVAETESDESKPWCSGPEGQALLADAARSAEAAIRLEPGADSAHSLLGRIAVHQCRPERARVHLERALRLRPDPVDLYYLGLILDEQDHLDRAIRVVRRGRKLARTSDDPRYRGLQSEMEFMLARALTRRASLDRSRRDLRKARRYLDAVRQVFPDDEDVDSLERAMRGLDHRVDRRDPGGVSGNARATRQPTR